MTRLCPRLLSPELLGQPPDLPPLKCTLHILQGASPRRGADHTHLILKLHSRHHRASEEHAGSMACSKTPFQDLMPGCLPTSNVCPRQATPRPLHAEPRGTGLASQFLSPSHSLSGQLLLILQNSLHVLPPPRSPPGLPTPQYNQMPFPSRFSLRLNVELSTVPTAGRLLGTICSFLNSFIHPSTNLPYASIYDIKFAHVPKGKSDC